MYSQFMMHGQKNIKLCCMQFSVPRLQIIVLGLISLIIFDTEDQLWHQFVQVMRQPLLSYI